MPGTLRADTIARLNSTIGEFERTNGAEMAVVVIGSLDGLSIEEAAVELFELWGIGKKSTDNGLLLLWSTGDRRIRVEVGYGLEGVLPDGKVGAILDAYVMPRFRSGEFDEGLLAGVDALLSAARDEPVELPSQRSESYESGSTGVVAVVSACWGHPDQRRLNCRLPEVAPPPPPPLPRVSDADDPSRRGGRRRAARGGQQAEERVGSVDYDVWKCAAAGIISRCGTPMGQQLRAVPPVSPSHEVVHREGHRRGDHDQQRQRTRRRALRVLHLPSRYTKVLPRIEPSNSSSGGSSSGGSSSGSFGGGGSGGGGASGATRAGSRHAARGLRQVPLTFRACL